jgi:hypothetical protein
MEFGGRGTTPSVSINSFGSLRLGQRDKRSNIAVGRRDRSLQLIIVDSDKPRVRCDIKILFRTYATIGNELPDASALALHDFSVAHLATSAKSS